MKGVLFGVAGILILAVILIANEFAVSDLSRQKAEESGLMPGPVAVTELDRSTPDRAFMAQPLYATPDVRMDPAPSGFTVHQIVEGLGDGKRTWKAIKTGQWLLTIQRVDQVTDRRMTLKVLFATIEASGSNAAIVARALANDQELDPNLIFELVRRAAINAASHSR